APRALAAVGRAVGAGRGRRRRDPAGPGLVPVARTAAALAHRGAKGRRLTPGPPGATLTMSLLLIRWKEYADFPDWGRGRVKGKTDAGPGPGALGAGGSPLRPAGAGGGEDLELPRRLSRRRPERITVIRLPVVRRVRVRNSGGLTEERPAVEL